MCSDSNEFETHEITRYVSFLDTKHSPLFHLFPLFLFLWLSTPYRPCLPLPNLAVSACVLSGLSSPSRSGGSDPASSSRSSRAVTEGGAGHSHHMADRSPAASPGAMRKLTPDQSSKRESEREREREKTRRKEKKKTQTT